MEVLRSWSRFFRPSQVRKPRRATARPRTRLNLDVLEDRTVPTAVSPFRSFDGTGNNLAHPNWGSAGTDLLRMAAAEYWDNISSVGGQDRPSPRLISNVIADQGDEDIISDRFLSAMIYAWGQFVDHDLDLTPTGTSETLAIPVPTGDPFFDPNSTGTQSINTFRSIFDANTGTSAANPRQQINTITAWLDGSMIYGSSKATSDSLRAFAGGLMIMTNSGLLPSDAAGNFLAGDTRVNENPELTSLQTLFVREHNRWARAIASANPTWSDETVFQTARARVIAEVESITFNEWLPTLLGTGAVRSYRGYDSTVNPGIATEFSTAGFRLGHSLLGNDVEFLDNNGLPVRDEVALSDAFNNPGLVREQGIATMLKYLASDPSSELDSTVVGSVRNFLFGQPGQGGFDLASLNIARGRDHGLADYNTVRQAYHLPKVTSFAQITSNTEVQAKLQQLYGSVDNIDLWVGALAEDHVPGSSTGPTLRAIVVDQFSRLRDGDRFWFERTFSSRGVQDIKSTSLGDVIRRNTATTNLQGNVFVFKSAISGTLFRDANHNGRQDFHESGTSGRTVALIDTLSGDVVATTVSNSRGEYRFGIQEGLRTGKYRIALVKADGSVPPPKPGDRVFSVTRGDQFFTNDIAV